MDPLFPPRRNPRAFLLLAALGWLLLYQALQPAAQAAVRVLPEGPSSHLGGALEVFFYDTPKVLLLLTGIVFVMGMVNSYFTPERTRSSALTSPFSQRSNHARAVVRTGPSRGLLNPRNGPTWTPSGIVMNIFGALAWS